jgi:hypothetical protein
MVQTPKSASSLGLLAVSQLCTVRPFAVNRTGILHQLSA